MHTGLCRLRYCGEHPDELTGILVAELSEQRGRESATVFGQAVRLPAASAALINGAASHALDFDDVNLAMPGHPSVAILPGLLALGGKNAVSSGRRCPDSIRCRL